MWNALFPQTSQITQKLVSTKLTQFILIYATELNPISLIDSIIVKFNPPKPKNSYNIHV